MVAWVVSRFNSGAKFPMLAQTIELNDADFITTVIQDVVTTDKCLLYDTFLKLMPTQPYEHLSPFPSFSPDQLYDMSQNPY
jgi:hypothetical protein